jgi:polynucleotide 5'-hydroxyl-kinase GRC3/NOL9
MSMGSADGGRADALRLVGAVSPPGHLLQMLSGILRLAEKAASADAAGVVCDSSGFVTGDMAREFQVRVVDALRPRHLVAIQHDDELEPVLRCFGGLRMSVHRLALTEAVRPRSREQRRRRRRRRFGAYFRGADSARIRLDACGLHGHVPDLSRRQGLQGRLVAPCDEEGFALALALLQGVEQGGSDAVLLAPPFDRDRMRSLQFGSIRLHPDGRQIE